MKNLFFISLMLFSVAAWSQSSMRRCTLLPVTDSVGGAIGFKVFEDLENQLKKSNWCTYVSNSGMINVFSRYRENLPQYLKTKEVLTTVSQKLKVGSLIRVAIVNEVKGVEVQMEVYGENGEDIYFQEKTNLSTDNISAISQTAKNWLDLYAKTIPYDAQINGILGDQITLDVGKGYPIHVGQEYVVKRAINKKRHPLLKKIVDWDTEVLAGGKVFNISDNQALGNITVRSSDKRLEVGDWVRLEEYRAPKISDKAFDKKDDELGKLGVLSVALFAAKSTVDTSTPTGNNSMSGPTFGLDFKVEGWITRQYFAALQVARSLGSLSKDSGTPAKDKISVNNGFVKIMGGYKYLPIGFFYGPQIDVYAGYANYSFDLDSSEVDGFGKNSISGLMLGVGANIPINRDYRFFTKAEFIPFPSFKDTDDLFGSMKSAAAMDLEAGVKYQYTPRMTLDASLGAISAKAKFKTEYKEVSYKDTWRLKLGASFNF